MQSINFEDFDQEHLQPHLARLAKALNSAKRVVAITGAGISVSAGIPVRKEVRGSVDC